MTNPLANLQHAFQEYILGDSERALNQVESSPALSAERRLDIYHNAYRVRLGELLADTYERVMIYIGDDNFTQFARRYVETHPPTSRNLRDYGGTFPAFLADIFPNDAEVAELAEMDVRLRNAFDATDAETLQVADIAAIQPQDWDAVIFTLHPTASFQQFHWNTPAIWQRLNEETAPPTPERLNQAETWLFWRKALQPHFRSLSDEESTALQTIVEKCTFGEVCSRLADVYPDLDVAQNIGAWLRVWLADGVLAKSTTA